MVFFISDVEREKRESVAFAFPSRGANMGSILRAFRLRILYIANVLLQEYNTSKVTKVLFT